MDLKEVRMALEKNQFTTYYVKTKEEVVPLIDKLTKEEVTFSHGGSVTLQQCGVLDFLKTKGSHYLSRDLALQTGGVEAYFSTMRNALLVDVYISGVNAITESGFLYNVDANGNRVGALLFGPKKVILVTSTSKIVANEEAAIRRVKEIAAPLNAQRLNRATPCAKTGKCEDCDSAARICNIAVFQRKSMVPNRIHIILVEEKLGY